MTVEELMAEFRERGLDPMSVMQAGAQMLVEQNPAQAKAMAESMGLGGLPADTRLAELGLG